VVKQAIEDRGRTTGHCHYAVANGKADDIGAERQNLTRKLETCHRRSRLPRANSGNSVFERASPLSVSFFSGSSRLSAISFFHYSSNRVGCLETASRKDNYHPFP
jgi:hypothetical protein